MRVPNNSLFIFGLCHVFFLLSTGLLRSKTQPCQHRCSFRFFLGRDDGGSSRHLDDEVGGLNLPGKSKDEGQGIASYLFATSADGKIRNHQLCASQFLHFCGQKTLCHIQEQHGRR